MRRFMTLALAAVAVSACSTADAPTATDAPSLTRLAGADQGGHPLNATLLGANEVPRLGDPDGSGTARITVNVGKGTLCYELAVTDIQTATAAHIHEAPAGTAGPVIVTLAAPASGSSSGCLTSADDADITNEFLKELIQSPSDYYVNVHNRMFPGGALRGQLQ